MIKGKGSALIEYALPIALIALVVGMSLYTLANSGLLTNLFGNSLKSEYDPATKSLYVNKNRVDIPMLAYPAPGSLGGNPSQPVEKCDGEKCNIDFGSFILTGIPENFDEYLNSHGNSGGEELISNLLMQISEQLNDDGDISGSIQYKNLANIGHFVSKIDRHLEDAVSECSSLTSVLSMVNCTKGKLSSTKAAIPSNLDGVIKETASVSYDAYLNQDPALGTSRVMSFGAKIYGLKNGTLNATDEPYNPATQASKIYLDISSNPNYSTALKAVTQELYSTIGKLRWESTIKYYTLNTIINGTYNPANFPCNIRDMATGIQTGEFIYSPSYSVDEIRSVDDAASGLTNFDSALICTTGKNDSNGNACK